MEIHQHIHTHICNLLSPEENHNPEKRVEAERQEGLDRLGLGATRRMARGRRRI